MKSYLFLLHSIRNQKVSGSEVRLDVVRKISAFVQERNVPLSTVL
jgi:hypothetical protein